MATNKSESARLAAHPEPQQLAAHQDNLLIEEHYDNMTAAAPVTFSEDVIENSSKGLVPKGLKWGMAAMLILALASAIAVVVGLNHHSDRNSLDTHAYTTPGGNFLLYGNQLSSIPDSKANTLMGNNGYTISEINDMANTGTSTQTATMVSADGRTSLIAISDPTTEVVYLFEIDESDIPENSTLNEFAKQLSQTDDQVTIVAYTDRTGSASHNQQLSKERAAALGDYLSHHGVSADRITSQGKGETTAYGADNFNRRAELHVN